MNEYLVKLTQEEIDEIILYYKSEQELLRERMQDSDEQEWMNAQERFYENIIKKLIVSKTGTECTIHINKEELDSIISETRTMLCFYVSDYFYVDCSREYPWMSHQIKQCIRILKKLETIKQQEK